jgi:hypothetical protein
VIELPSDELIGSREPRLVIIGLDGATWTVIRPMVERGELPTLHRWMEEGAHGSLQSLEMMCTPRIWASIDTGKVPEKHGIVDFYSASLQNLMAKALWEILSDQGWSVGLYCWLNTWPPPTVNGFVIPGWLARTPATHPLSVDYVKRIELLAQRWKMGEKGGNTLALAFRAWRQGLRFNTLLHSTVVVAGGKLFRLPIKKRLLNKLVLRANIDADLVTFLVRRFSPQLLMYYCQYIDNVSHNYWKYYQPECFDDVDQEELHRYSGGIERVYRAVDACLSRVASCMGEETTVCCVSDHGFRAAPEELAPLTGMKLSFLKKQIALPYQIEGCLVHRRWYLRPKQPRGDDRWRKELSDTLKSFVVRKYEIPLFEVMPNEDQEFVVVRLSPRLAELRRVPEKASVASLAVEHAGGQFQLGQLLLGGYRRTGDHDREGVVVLKGPGVRKGQRISASVLDVVPTLLALLGMPVGEDMDGRVITEAIRPEYLKQHPVTMVPTYDDEKTAHRGRRVIREGEAKILERLRGLGYLS